jgi:hypothetical protein
MLVGSKYSEYIQLLRAMTPLLARNSTDGQVSSIPNFGPKAIFFPLPGGKKIPPLIGEFIDEKGIQGKQFGLLGACFGLGMGRAEGLNSPTLDNTATLLADALQKLPEDRSPEQIQLMKDFGRITSKTVIALLVVDKEQAESILQTILRLGISNNLIKPVLDDSSMMGDVLITAFVFHILHISRIAIGENELAVLKTIAARLQEELVTGNDSLPRQLFVSSALCLFDYPTHIQNHIWLVTQLYSNKHQLRSVHLDSPFIEIFYEDGSRPFPARTRYVRIPKAYALLIAIYIVLRDERLFFRFPAVRRILRVIEIPYSRFVAGDRNRSAMYYIFFLYLSLHPKQHFTVPDRTRGTYLNHCRKYYLRNMTWQSWIGLAIAVGCLVGSAYFILDGLFADPTNTTEIGRGALLFIFGFVTWLLRTFGGKKE